MIKLTILVPTVPSRLHYFYPKIMTVLLKQIGSRDDIELMALFDNKKRTIGTKRNNMLHLAQGEYLVFVDDDDRIADDYVETIMNHLYENPETDCVCFDSICHIDHKDLHCKYGIEFEYGQDGTEWRGKPAHTMVWKASIAKSHQYENINNGEDIDWVLKSYKDIKTQTRIEKVLYYYDANYQTTSESAGLSDDVIKRNIELLMEEDK